MVNRGAIKLFAVVALAGASTADARPNKPANHHAERVAAMAAAKPTATRGERGMAATERVDWASYIDQDAADVFVMPLVLGNGRPACGNTGGKGGYMRHCVDVKSANREAQPQGDLAAELVHL